MIKIKAFVFNPIQVNTYIISNENSECIIIDPGCYYRDEFEELTGYVEENRFVPLEMIATHFHFDHLMGAAVIAKKYNIELSGHEHYKLLYEQLDIRTQAQMFDFTFDMPPTPSKEFKHNDVIKFGHDEITVLHIPGHSPCSIALHLAKQKTVFSGDILFEGSIGRTDLYMGNTELLLGGIKEHLLTLDDDTLVLPGHGYKTSIGAERRHNPFLVF